MRKFKKGDYTVRFTQVKELLKKYLLNLLYFDEVDQHIYRIIQVEFTIVNNNIGTLFNKIYEDVLIVKGIHVVSETNSKYITKFIEFEPNKGVEWVEKIIPRRVKSLERIEEQLNFMKIK